MYILNMTSGSTCLKSDLWFSPPSVRCSAIVPHLREYGATIYLLGKSSLAPLSLTLTSITKSSWFYLRWPKFIHFPHIYCCPSLNPLNDLPLSLGFKPKSVNMDHKFLCGLAHQLLAASSDVPQQIRHTTLIPLITYTCVYVTPVAGSVPSSSSSSQ